MHCAIYLGHPAHFHLFKNTIKNLEHNGHEVSILIKKKDILEDLLINSNIQFKNILPEGRKNNKAGIALGVLKRDLRLLSFSILNRPDVFVGTSSEIGHVGMLLRIPSINVNEDDAAAVPLYCKVSYPWCTHILSPRVCNNGNWEKKSVKYEGYHELAYLHPNHFTPSRSVVNSYFSTEEPYFLIRFAKLTAHHDVGIRGIGNELARRIIDVLSPKGRVFITSERELASEFEPYRLAINPLDIHHVMAFASLYIGDSQTMAAEAGVLGTPFVRFNDFVGRIGYLKELEDKYGLGFGIRPDNPEKLFAVVGELLETKNLKEIFAVRRRKMLDDKIDTALFMTWFIENYPQSVKIMQENPDCRRQFSG